MDESCRMNENERALLVTATDLATLWHEGQRRKASDIPYVSHLLQVEGLVLEHGGDCEQAIAGLLHDALEDAPDSEQRAAREVAIRENFGPAVLEIVLDCTDTGSEESLEDKRPWRERKDQYMRQMREASARTHLVAACDKCHNLHAIVFDVRSLGAEVFGRFSSTPEEIVWYYTSVVELVRNSVPRRLALELDQLLDDLRAAVDSIDD